MLRFAPGIRSSFPQDDYTPFGYLHTPHHTGTNPGGLLRSVPPIGFGLYRRGFTWYGMEMLNNVNAYVSILMPSVKIDGTLLAAEEDFKSASVELVSCYHSSNILSYDFALKGVEAALAWYSDEKDTLYCRVALKNTGAQKVKVEMDADHVYGMTDRHWWGSDAVTARYVDKSRAVVSKILAYGDVFALGSDLTPDGGAVTASAEELDAHRRNGFELPSTPVAVSVPGPLHAALEWKFDLASGEEKLFTIALSKAVNEKFALDELTRALGEADRVLQQRIHDDNLFCDNMPVLGEGWPAAWRRGMVYHYQTLRMNVYPAMGLFKHRWDGMQTANPRMVLGETCIDMASLCYADIETALEVLTTTFEDSPDVYVPCCREDGSVNMIGTDGSECATALMWGFPWKTLRTLLAESRNVPWLRRLYPHLKKCIEWWRENRTDSEGWYHCNNSWESGQDGSKRFVTGEDDSCPEGMNSDHVRAVDLESTMAQTARIMAEFAQILGENEDQAYYQAMYEQGLERVRKMFFEDRFRDVNALTGDPFMADAHLDTMLLMPLATAQATPEQTAATQWILDEMVEDVKSGPRYASKTFAYWPAFLQTMSASLKHSGRVQDAADVVAVMANCAWTRDDSRETWPLKPIAGIPDRYHRRIPGNARENLSNDVPTSGTENYGWGCVDIALFGEYILGLHPVDALGTAYTFQPVLPEMLEGEKFRVCNYPLMGGRADIELLRTAGGIRIEIDSKRPVKVIASDGEVSAEGTHLSFELVRAAACELRRA